MLRLLGAGAVVLGSVWAARERLSRLRQSIRQLHQLGTALDTMARLLRVCAPDTAELLQQARESASGEVSDILGKITLNLLEYENLSAQWDAMSRNNALQLNEAERRALRRPGRVLGRCDALEQAACLEETSRLLRQSAAERERALEQQRQLWYTLSVSAALLAVVMLL